jgi:hypothetical protein
MPAWHFLDGFVSPTAEQNLPGGQILHCATFDKPVSELNVPTGQGNGTEEIFVQ